LKAPLFDLTRAQILSFRRRTGGLDQRLPPGPDSLRQAAWAGLQDSTPRAALLSIHARVGGTGPVTWEDPSLVQLWGPRHNVYTVAARDLALFTIGIHPDDERRRRRAEDCAERIQAGLNGARMNHAEVGRVLGVHPNSLQYAATTGTVLIRWDGARSPTVWTVPPPEADPKDARLELARRYLHIFGPATPAAFGWWSGLGPETADGVFEALGGELTPVRTPIGEARMLAADEPILQAAPGPAAPARLLPSGDAFLLFNGSDRELLIPDAARRQALWTTRVWPGGVLVEGEVVGTWRRSGAALTVQSWVRLSRAGREAVESEAAGLPLPGVRGPIRVRWEA
jgi:hypothetical protein